MKCVIVIVLIGAFIAEPCQGQRIPPPPQSFLNGLNNQNQQQSPQNASGGPSTVPSMQTIQQLQKNDELANVKDESIKRVLLELSTLQTPSQMSETMARVAALVGPLFVANFDQRKDEITAQSRDSSEFPQRLLSAVTDIQGEEVKALVLQKNLVSLHASDFAFLPLAIQYGLQEDVVRNLSGTKLATTMRANPGDTVIASKVSRALLDRPEQQIEFLQSLGTKLIPGVQQIIMENLLAWWGDPHQWKDRELSMLISAGSPLLAYMPQSDLQSLDTELADRFVTTLGQTQDIARAWWMKPMSLKKAWFDLAKGARYFGAVHEWSFRRMQKLSFLLEGAAPEDLQLIPPVPEIKGLVIRNHYTELQTRVVFDAFYNTAPLLQEDLQEFQFHILDLIPTQLQRFDFSDSFGTLDEMLTILDRLEQPSYPCVLQISYFMWPIVNSSNSVMNIAPPSTWQRRELSQLGQTFFLLPKSVMSQIKPGVISWDSGILDSIRSSHLTQFQVWRLTSQILPSVDDRLKPDYIYMIPPPFQKGIPTQNISEALLGTTTVRPEVLRALVEETPGMLISQRAVVLQRLQNRLGESTIIRMMIGSMDPSEMFKLINPRELSKNMANIIKTIMEIPETGRFGLTSIQTKLLPRTLLSLWLKWVRENFQVAKWTAEDLLGRSSVGATNELDYAVMGLSCRDIALVDPWDVLSVIMHYRHELYALRKVSPSSSLSFNVNLRTCVLQKFIEYLKQKRFLNEDLADGHVLAGISDGEISAVGGEILSIIPAAALDQLDMMTRLSIIKEIGSLDMLELFSLIPLDNIHWFGRTLFRDIAISSSSTSPSLRRRRQTIEHTVNSTTAGTDSASSEQPKPAEIPTATEKTDTANTDPAKADAGAVNVTTRSGSSTNTETGTPFSLPAAPSLPPTLPLPTKIEMDLESLNRMGNLLCYADNLFDSTWPRSILKDVLEAKTDVGEKTCCLSKTFRDKWFGMLKDIYGADTSQWTEFDLASIADLLIVLPDAELQKVSIESLGKASTPIMRQSAYANRIRIPGKGKPIQFAAACANALGEEGSEFMSAYKRLMKRLFQGSQFMVNTVKTTQELIREAVSRTGRLPRSVEHTLGKRQVPPLSFGGGELQYSGAPVSAYPGLQNVQTQPVLNTQNVAFAQAGSATGVDPGVSSFQSSQPQQLQARGLPAQDQATTGPQIVSGSISNGNLQQQSGTAPQLVQPGVQAQPPQSGTPPQQPIQAQQSLPASQSQQPVSGAQSQPPAPGSQPQQPLPGSQSQQPVPGAQSQQPIPGSQPQQPLPGTQSQPPLPGSQPQQPPPGAQPQQTVPGSQVQQPIPGSQQIDPQFQTRSATGNQAGQQVTPGGISPQQSQPGQQQQPPQVGNQPPQPQASAAQNQQQSGLPQPQQLQQTNPAQSQQAGLPQQMDLGQSQPGIPSPQQFQTRSTTGQQQNTAGQPIVPGSVSPQLAASGGNFQQSQPGVQSQSQQPQQLQSGTQPQPQQSQPGSQQGAPPVQMQPGTGQSMIGGRSSVDPSQQAQFIQQQQLGSERERSLAFGPLQDDTHSSEITCHGVKAAGTAAIGLTIEDLNKLSQADLFDCVEALGRIDWDEATKSQIVTLLKNKLEFNHEAINALTLIELGDLVTAFSTEDGPSTSNSTSLNDTVIHSDVSLIDLTLPQSLDVLATLGEQVTDSALLKALAGKFNQDNKIFPGFSEGIARPENLRIVVMSLGNIICGLNDKIVNSIFETDESLFIDTSKILGTLEGCNNEVLSTLAAHAIRQSNYGSPSGWSQEDLEAVGVVFAGLKPDVIATVPADAMEGLTPLAVENLPAPSILALTVEQLQKISYGAAKAFNPTQLNNFSPEQTQAIQSIILIPPELFNVPVVSVAPTDDTNNPREEVVRDVEKKDIDPNENGTHSIGGRSRSGPDPDQSVPIIVIIDDNPSDDPALSDTNANSPRDVSSASRIKTQNYVYSFLLIVFVYFYL